MTHDTVNKAREYVASDHREAKGVYRCPECGDGKFLIRHGDRVVCKNQHVIQRYGNGMTLWDKENFQEKEQSKARGGWEYTRNPADDAPPRGAETRRAWNHSVGMDTYRCPRHPEYAMELRHGWAQVCPADGHRICVTGTVINMWNPEPSIEVSEVHHTAKKVGPFQRAMKALGLIKERTNEENTPLE